MTSIAILGSGVMGSALAVPLADNGHDVRLVGTFLDTEIIDSVKATGIHPGLQRKLPASVHPFQLEEVEAAFEGAEIALSGVNSFGVPWAGQQLARLLQPGMTVIAIAKGMEAAENGDLRILPDLLAEQVPEALRSQISWAAIGGPSIAGEVAARRDTCVVFTGRDQVALDRLAATFRTGWYHVWTSTDLVGVEVSAAMKNCYAVGVGFAEGVLDRLGQTDSPDRNHNYEAALFAQGAVETGQMVRLLGGRPETPYGLAGVGDMFVTSTGGRNVRVGRLVGGGLHFSDARARMGSITLEGAAAIQAIGGALPKLTDRGIIGPEAFPLMRHLHAVVGQDEPPRIPWSAFFGSEAWAGAVAAGVDESG
ncbi:MAG TPA: 2-dehydropantoate 2-reductase N-terminal domain-containing protein [Actinomycetes bacterium]|jgi:glycerol-3-phosphate dehydrogenase (NAD(P)+)|nr:2-dehydropantoate 2-reductase N-terminal domain-containing protein [Actinomycetes bacterium]